MIYMTAEQAEDMGIFDHTIAAHVVILSEDEMKAHVAKLLA